MASVKDTATFFSNGNCKQFEHVLKLYPQCLKLRANKRAKKPEELIKLDNWYQNELPILIKSRGKDAHLIHDELVQTMKWKQTRGKFYPQLSYLVKVNTPRAVMVETKKAFKKLPNLELAITALCNLKGVGTTMASALLAAAAPDKAPFMADECLSAIPDIEGIDYTTKRYLIFVTHLQSVVERLNKEGKNGTDNAVTNGTSAWTIHQVELALWTHFVANEMKPELLDDIPAFENGTGHHDQKNGGSKDPADSDESNQESTNGKHPLVDGLDDTTTSFNEDSLDKPSTPLVLPPVDENTNDSIATNDSAAIATAIVACNNVTGEETSSSLEEEPPAKKTKIQDEDEDK